MMFKIDYSKVIGINIFLERRSSSLYVGKLERKQNKYIFSYSESYLNYQKAIPLAHEFPLTKKYFESKKIFSSFQDRVPSKENPAYPEYCKLFGISPEENDIMVLLSTIGKKGPSWFVFEPIWGDTFSSEDLKAFRRELGLSTRDFANCFNISQATITRIEGKKASGKEIFKFLEVLYLFPEAAAYYIEKYASTLHSKTKEKVISALRARKFGWWSILSPEEVGFSRKAAKILSMVDWAQRMLKSKPIQCALSYSPKFNRKGEQEVKEALFEVRFAYAIYAAGLEAQYEFKTGVGKSSVDFAIFEKGTASPKWLVELTNTNDSKHIKENTFISNNGNKVFSSTLTPWDTENSAEVLDLKKIQNVILNKVSKELPNKTTVPIKFPTIQQGAPFPQYHVIVVNMEGFNAGESDEEDHENIIHGSENIKDLCKRIWINDDGTKELFQGVFNSNFPDPRGRYLQERIHAIVVIHEKFVDETANGGINNQSYLKLYMNPRFLDHLKEEEVFPLDLMKVLKRSHIPKKM